MLAQLNAAYEQRRSFMSSVGESLVLPFEHLPTLPPPCERYIEVAPSRQVGDSYLWKGLLGDDACQYAFDACSQVPLDDLAETGSRARPMVITPQHSRPMRATMSLCAGAEAGAEAGTSANRRLLLKYGYRGVTKENWQCRPIPQGLFDVVAYVFFRIRGCLPEAYRSIFPNCFQLLLYRAGQCVSWHHDGTPCALKSIVDESPVLTIRCRPSRGQRAKMAFYFGTRSETPTVLHEFELEGGDVFLMGPESDRTMMHRTRGHDASGAICYTIVVRWCAMWHSFVVPDSGRTYAVWSDQEREIWAAAAASLASRDAQRQACRDAERARSAREAEDEEHREGEREWGGRITRARTRHEL